MLGLILFFFYLLIGIALVDAIVPTTRPLIKLWIGTVTGIVLLMWSNVPFSFIFGFTKISHLLGLLLSLIILVLVFIIKKRKKEFFEPLAIKERWPIVLSSSEKAFSWILLAFMIVSIILLVNHTIYKLDGAIYTGQCTYGDMNMHLGFITSIAEQGKFPPEYSILPGAKLNYPFLCDSVSSSLYLFGSSLQVSYIIPMAFAFYSVFAGFWFLADRILKEKNKTIMAFTLFFLNGGFGLFYFLDNLRNNPGNFTRIFTGFYETPTNLVNRGSVYSNIRWTNTIVDMMLPQRATLFGWTVLFLAIYLLYIGVFEKKRNYMLFAGIFAGLIPMVHTHSFFACGLLAIGWIIVSLIRDKFNKEIIISWLYFGIPALVIAMPQLFVWTFNAAIGNDNFVRYVFNWANDTDNWLWFWIKNIGLAFILLPIAFLNTSKKKKGIFAGTCVIFLIGEFLVFQPNPYDNNKLFLIWFVFVAILVGELLVDLYDKLKGIKGRQILAGIVIFILINAGILTLAREMISGFRPYSYQLYSADLVAATDFIKDNTKKDATFLTYNNHNNAIASLTGRNIFCGAGTFLYFHGVSYQDREALIYRMYTNVEDFEKYRLEYDVNYVLISSYEKAKFKDIIYDHFEAYEKVFEQGEAVIYKIS